MSSDGKYVPVTMRDVAKRAGCSRGAVSHVLMGTGKGAISVGKQTAARIRRAAEELGYYPNLAARQLAGGRSSLFGVIAGDWGWATGVRIFAWIENWATQRGYQVLIAQTANDRQRLERAIVDCLGRGVEGVMYVGYRDEAQWDQVGPLLARIPRVVSVLARPDVPGGGFVDVDVAEGTRRSVAHLYERGRRRIGLLLEDLEHTTNRQRREAFLAAHREFHLPVDESRIYVGTRDWFYDSPELERKIDGALRRLIDDRQADAILADDDYGAALLLRSLARRGLRVPEDVAIVGYGNQLVSHFLYPELTTVDIRVREMIQTAVAMLTDAIEDPKTAKMQSVTLQPQLLVRRST